MKNILLLILLTLNSTLVTAQLIKQEMNCAGDTKKDVPFKLELKEKIAVINLRDETYQLNFKKNRVGDDGYKWSIYEGQSLILSVQHSKDNYANLFRKDWNSQLQMNINHPLSSSSCK